MTISEEIKNDIIKLTTLVSEVLTNRDWPTANDSEVEELIEKINLALS